MLSQVQYDFSQLSPEGAASYLNSRSDCKLFKSPTVYVAGYQFTAGQQLILDRKNKTTTLFLMPGKWLEQVGDKLGRIRHYAADEPRNSNFRANAPKLDVGFPVVQVQVPTLSVLKQLCDVYSGSPPKEHEPDTKFPISKVSPMEALPLNQIFFGPPGTGKTYITIEAAVKAAEPGFVWEKRDQLKVRYDELVAAGRIRFVTFHQSYSYEDFVEGLAANSTDGKISYEKKLGVFRKLVNAAREYRTTEVRKASDSFTDCWQAFIKQLDESPTGVAIKTKRSQFVVTEVEDNTIRFDKNQGNSVHTLALSTLHAVFDGQREVHGGLQPYYEALIAYIRELGQQLSATEVVRQNYVLVIDEINRGNISRIFGELITLIEPSKRIGAPEALEVTLPLTGDKFGVPDNLYIIGTMNTADRSLAGLDLALRRRFTFVEMPPKPELLDGLIVDGVKIGEMLRVMNQRITALLDRDHCIGHAYFMPLQDNRSLDLLADIFKQNILPLLQEYFFEDWQRIRWVLADQTKPDSFAFIVKELNMDAEQLFPSVSQFKPRDCWRINTEALKQVEAYQRIYQTAGQLSEQEA